MPTPFPMPKQIIVELFLEEMFLRRPIHAGSAPVVVIVALATIAASCSHPAKRAVVPAPPARTGTTETGVASWYGVPYDGRQTASGEIYDMYKLTAAHRKLPFQTWIQVENLTNGKRVDVRINDRGPFVGHRIIDLSRTAAKEIDMLGPGTARVRLTVIAHPTNPVSTISSAAAKSPALAKISPAPRAPSTNSPVASSPTVAWPSTALSRSIGPMQLYAVQAGAFADRERAESLRATMTEAFADARTLVDAARTPALWRVLVGREMTIEQASNLAARVRSEAGAGIVVPEPEQSPPMRGRLYPKLLTP